MERYRLAPVRDLRERDEHRRHGELASAVGDARTTAAEVAAAAGRVAALRDTIAEATGRRGELVGAPALLVLSDRYLARLRRDLDAAIGARLRAEATHAGKLAVIDEARGRLAVARADRQVIERHFASWREAKKKLAERRED